MNIHICTDQEECRTAIAALGIGELFKPLPPLQSCDMIMGMDNDSVWIVGSNIRGHYTLYMLEGADKSAAFAFFDTIRKGTKPTNQRLSFVGGDGDSPSLN